MIVFKKLRWKNLLSTGNDFIEVDLCGNKKTLVIGTNGAGKSTMLEALCYVLYNKSFRKINKPELLNSINNKNLVVEVEFSVAGKEYKIVRGEKPTIFEIYVNGTLLNQNAENRDYQEMLEKQILKLKFKSFMQVVILGKANYQPFMQLPAQSRREVIEDLLDIQIFSLMNTILKDRINANRSALSDIDYQISLVENKIEMHERHKLELAQNNDEIIKQRQNQVKGYTDQLVEVRKRMNQISTEIEDADEKLVGADKVKKAHADLKELALKIETRAKKINKALEFYDQNDHCPTCLQQIATDFKVGKVASKVADLSEIDDARKRISARLDLADKRLSLLRETEKAASVLRSSLQQEVVRETSLSGYISEIAKDIERLQRKTTSIVESSDQATALGEDLVSKQSAKAALLDTRATLTAATVLLKDGGIKTRIIKQYIPVINQLINKYLAALDFYCEFTINEQFNEKILSRHRDKFSYNSFSEGQKQRIDLALMFTWREITKMRNAATTNLLIFDETLDGSLDSEGADNFLRMIDELTQDSNVIIISHAADMVDKFDTVLQFKLFKNFTEVTTL